MNDLIDTGIGYGNVVRERPRSILVVTPTDGRRWVPKRAITWAADSAAYETMHVSPDVAIELGVL